ncbi:hypothetical protein [Nocardia aurantiaca]|uniref:Uncharacterized protein n=1 Tax=Nocardia aurantiaca TaxID=2675850 RepID=A0A6I3KZY0_9NOCA|nr:hypothetical protein [Nocardia aurantiaca]MTE16283.1 hypothetical protein [Nocardia aurantiaca]
MVGARDAERGGDLVDDVSAFASFIEFVVHPLGQLQRAYGKRYSEGIWPAKIPAAQYIS